RISVGRNNTPAAIRNANPMTDVHSESTPATDAAHINRDTTSAAHPMNFNRRIGAVRCGLKADLMTASGGVLQASRTGCHADARVTNGPKISPARTGR